MLAVRRHTTGGWRRERSPVKRAIERFEQILDIVIAELRRQAQGPRMNHKGLSFGLRGSHQPQAKKVVYRRLYQTAGAAELASQSSGNFVKREFSAHALMIA
jgi:hypothetical protein